MRKTMAIVATVDTQQQSEEKNLSWEDYPMFNINTGRKLKKTCSHYYKSWDEYISQHPKQKYRAEYVLMPEKIQAQSTARTRKSRENAKKKGLTPATFLLSKRTHETIKNCQEKKNLKNRSEALEFLLS